MRSHVYWLFYLLFLITLTMGACRSDTSTPAPQTKAEPSIPSSAVTPDSVPAVPAADNDWPMFLHDYSATGHTPHYRLDPPLHLRWKYKTGGPITASPIVVQGTVYIGSQDGIFYALDAHEWGERWHLDTGLRVRYGAAYWNGYVYFTAIGHGICRLYAVNAQNGQPVWQFEMPTWTASAPRVDRGVVYVGAYEAKIFLFDALTGQVRSEESTRIKIGNADYLCVEGSLQPFPPAHVSQEVWKDKLPYSLSTPVDANGVMYLGAGDGKMYALERTSWQALWDFSTGGPIESPAAVADDALFFASRDGYVYALGTEEPAPQQDGMKGLVTHNRAPLYASPDLDADIYMYLQDGNELAVQETSGDWYHVILPNGRSGWMNTADFGIFDGDATLRYDQDQIETVQSLVLPPGAENPVWSPDGQQIAFLKRSNLSGQFWSANELWVTDARLKFPRTLCRGVFYNPNLSWSLDSKWISFEATQDDKAHVWVVHHTGRDLTRLIEGDAPTFSPGAHRILFRRWEQGIDKLYVIGINGSGIQEVYRVPIEGVVRQFTYLEPAVWSADGDMMAFGVDGQHYADGKSQILLIDPQGKLVQQVLTQSGSVHAMKWSPNKRYIAFVLSQNPAQELDAKDDNRLNVKDLSVPDAPKEFDAVAGAWSPDGNWLGYIEREPCSGVDWKVSLWNVLTDRKIALARMKAPLRSIQWISPTVIGLWATSGYIRDGKYQPALTEGWELHLNPKTLEEKQN